MASEIRNASIWQSGDLKINWVRHHMPLLNGLEEEFKQTTPFKGLKIALSVHLEAKTAYLCQVLAAAGAEMYVTGSNPLSTQDDIAAALVHQGLNVFAWYNATPEEYTRHCRKVIESGPNIIIDDGGDLVNTIHTDYPELIPNVIGGCEETTTGIIRLKGQALLSVDAMFDKMEAEYNGRAALYRESVTGLCSAFLVELWRAYTEQNSSDVNARLNSVLTYIREHLRTVTLEDAAAHASYSRTYFSHLFYEYTGEHFTDYVNRLRINEAVRLLINTDAAIEDIGPMLGYASKPFFYRMLRQFTGLTPGEMRKRAGGTIEKSKPENI